MTRFLRKGYLKLKCKECHTQHSTEGRDLIFDRVGSKQTDDGLETTHLCSRHFFCSCDTKIGVDIEVHEFPEGKILSINYVPKNAEVIEKLNISVSPI